MTNEQRENPVATIMKIEKLLDRHPSEGGDIVWLLHHTLENYEKCRASRQLLADALRKVVDYPGYDWNTDPLSLTILVGDALRTLET